MEKLSRITIINLTANILLGVTMKLQKERNLTNEEMEMVMSKVMLDISSAKSLEYANQILMLTQKIQQLEEKSKEVAKEDTDGESV